MRISENASVILDPPVDINGGAVTTPYVDMAEGRDLSVMIICGAIGATAGAAVTLKEATDKDGTGAQTLSYAGYYEVDTTTGGDVPTYNSGALTIGATDDNKVFIIEVGADQLDIDDSYTHVAAAIADPAVSAIVGVTLLLTKKRDTTASALST